MRGACSLLLLLTGIASADDLSVDKVEKNKISLGSFRTVSSVPSSFGYLLEKQAGAPPKVIQLLFEANPDRTLQGINITALKCRDAMGDPKPMDLEKGNPNCGIPPLPPKATRDVTLQLSVQFTDGTKPEDQTVTATYARTALPDLDAITGERELYVMAEDSVKATLLDDFRSHVNQIKIKMKFDDGDTAPEYNLGVIDVRPSSKGEPHLDHQAKDYIKLTLSRLLPSRPEPYKIIVSLDKALLSQRIQDLLDPMATELSFAVAMDASSTPARDASKFFLDATFTSFVNQFNPNKPVSPTNNGARRNVGIFGLSFTPEAKTWTRGLTNDEGGMHSFALQPYLKADVSTLPLAESDVPTQIADGVDVVYGYGKPGLAKVRGLLLSGGFRHESDRDFKFQIATGRFTATPLIRAFAQTRAYRDRVAKNQNAHSLVTAYSFTPKVGYEIGNVIRDRPERLLDNITFQDKISRLLIEAAFMIELKRLVTLSAQDTYYYHWQVDRRPQRNYVEAKVDVNAGFLFRRFGSRALSYGIVGKFQRGEQSPTFKVVNVFSLGVTFVR